MERIKGVNKRRRQRKNVKRHKRSMVLVSVVILVLVGAVTVSGQSLRNKEKELQAQKIELQSQIGEELERSEEIDDLKDYVGSDEHVEEKAKSELGLVYENETLFRSQN